MAGLVATAGAGLIALLGAAPGHGAAVAALVVALCSGAGGALAVALLPRAPARPSVADGEAELRIGSLMQLGGVPDQVARMTSAIAAAAGPVALVVPATRTVPVGLDPAVTVVQAGSEGADAAIAGFHRRCDAVRVLSARAVPCDAGGEVAAQLRSGAGWVVGRAEALNRDRFGPVTREQTDSALQRRATAAGLWTWQPDATVVATRLLTLHPLPDGRPMGSWLRARSAEGETGVVLDEVLARRAAPVAAQGYWPDTTTRQRAGVADLADAALDRSLRARARLVAAGLALRALCGWATMWWLAVLVLLADGSPVARHHVALAVTVLTAVALRWRAVQLAAGTHSSPVSDLVARLYVLPGSLSATTAALTRRVGARHRHVSTRPLVWLALLATAAAASVVLGARPGDTTARLAALAAAALLVLLWVFTVRSLVERSWQRVGFRIPLDVAATIDGDDTQRRLVDGAPGGFALEGPPSSHARGDELTVVVPGDGGPALRLHGTVAGVRRAGERDELLGVELVRVEPGTAHWAQLLLDAANGLPAPNGDTTPAARSNWVDRLAVGLVLAASAVVLASLVLVLIGVRPLVIRSGSMEPTYRIGDVVLVASEPASDIRRDQVVTRYDAPQAADSLTHRVRSVSRQGDLVRVETRGDANDGSEFWTVPADQQVGVVVASVPRLGLPLTAVRSSGVAALAVALVVMALIGVLLRPRRDETLSTDDAMPMEPSTTHTGER